MIWKYLLAKEVCDIVDSFDALAWLLDNADTPIRYRVLRELYGDDTRSRKTEVDFLHHPEVLRWLSKLKHDPTLHLRDAYHGSTDSQFENAIQKAVQLGLHSGLKVMQDAVAFYMDDVVRILSSKQKRSGYDGFKSILSANLLCLSGFNDSVIIDYMLRSLDELHAFVSQGSYDIYLSDDARDKLAGIPPLWRQSAFIKPELIVAHGFCFPLIYDILGLYGLFEHGDESASAKIHDVIRYIANDRYHHAIDDGYGILISGIRRYHAMGWDAKFPGWDDAAAYLGSPYASRLLYFALHASHYPLAVGTPWFKDVCRHLNTYKNECGTYSFPAVWLPEKTGYAVGGLHMSFGENRKKKNWREIESTFYMALLNKNIVSSDKHRIGQHSK